MLVLSGKKITSVLVGIFVAMFIITLMISYNGYNDEYISTVSLPVSGKVVVVDAGHGIPDEGAEVGDGTTEAETNLKIALKLQNLLEASGCEVVLTRSDENAIYDINSKTLKQKKISDIRNRVKIGNESSADIFVSIHLNKIPQTQYSGWQTFYNEKSAEGQRLAISIQNSLNSAIKKENNRVASKIDNIYIINNVEIPTTIVECGFLSNPEEKANLLTDSYQNRLAWGIYNGIIDYFYDKSSLGSG